MNLLGKVKLIMMEMERYKQSHICVIIKRAAKFSILQQTINNCFRHLLALYVKHFLYVEQFRCLIKFYALKFSPDITKWRTGSIGTR